MLSQKDQAIQWGIKDETTVKRFKSKLIKKDNGCIEFDGAFWDDRKMYRVFNVYKTLRDHGMSGIQLPVKAHRFAFALYYGFDKLPKTTVFTKDTKVVNHICHNKSCVNPKHLNILTSRENLLPENKRKNG